MGIYNDLIKSMLAIQLVHPLVEFDDNKIYLTNVPSTLVITRLNPDYGEFHNEEDYESFLKKLNISSSSSADIDKIFVFTTCDGYWVDKDDKIHTDFNGMRKYYDMNANTLFVMEKYLKNYLVNYNYPKETYTLSPLTLLHLVEKEKEAIEKKIKAKQKLEYHKSIFFHPCQHENIKKIMASSIEFFEDLILFYEKEISYINLLKVFSGL